MAKKWIFLEDDAISTVTKYGDVDEWDSVYLNQTQIVPAFAVVNLKRGTESIEDLEKYMKISFEETIADYRDKPKISKEDLGIKMCTVDDFKGRSLKLFKEFKR